MSWRDEPATIKQVNYAKSLAKKTGDIDLINWNKPFTKGEMTDMIDDMKTELGMPTNKPTQDNRPLPGEPLPPIDPMGTSPPTGNKRFVGVFTVTFAGVDKDMDTNKLFSLLRSNGYEIHAYEVTEL